MTKALGSPKDDRYLVLRSGDLRLAVPLSTVVDLVPPPDDLEPRRSASPRRRLRLSGEEVPLADLQAEAPHPPDDPPLVVVASPEDGRKVAVRADDLLGVQPLGAGATPPARGAQTVLTAAGPLLLLDVDELLGSVDARRDAGSR